MINTIPWHGFFNRTNRGVLQPVDAVRGKVEAESRQSLGILRRSVSYGGQGIKEISADLVPPTPAPSEAKGQLPRSGTFAARRLAFSQKINNKVI